MQRRILLSVITAFLFVSFFNWGCSKLDTTDIGSDLLPAVDNVNTFDTLLTVNTTQGIFNDTSIIFRTEDHALGAITNDPLFGTTRADVFMQLKPNFYPFYFGTPNDTLVALDSVVLCLKYIGIWGDSTIPVHLEVREVVDQKFRDSVYIERDVNVSPGLGAFLASTDVDPRTLGNYIKYRNGRDSIHNQIRIKLPTAWATQLLFRDSFPGHINNNAFYTDSAFRHFYNGLAVLANGSGNALLYVNLADTSTKLEVHYKSRKNNVMDTVYESLRLNTTYVPSSTSPPPSSTVNHIVRNRAGYPISSPASTDLYLQTSPGTYVNLNIPALSTLSNRVIHRAELIVEQIPTSSLDAILTPPNFLYLDLKDTTVAAKWKPVYVDLSPSENYDPDNISGYPFFPTGGVSYLYFGGYIRSKNDPFGTPIKFYNFNISRYVQRIVTQHYPNYQIRLYAPFSLSYPQYTTDYIPFSNNIGYGRVKVGSGTNPNYKLRLRIVYSKLK